MTAHDAILRLVDLLMQEKDKNAQLQLKLQQEKQKNMCAVAIHTYDF